ncbi:hypothetical protein LINGRAHAP2_LOCUS30598 [Linum grandiflorum]
MWLIEYQISIAFYGTSKIHPDRWFPCAGRTEVMMRDGHVWVRVDGIPLHLVSSDLFRIIGNRCGGFVEANSGMCLFWFD